MELEVGQGLLSEEAALTQKGRGYASEVENWDKKGKGLELGQGGPWG